MLDRRSFLQYFGIGASVIPIIGGMPQPQIEAKLIEEPKVEIKQAKALTVQDVFDRRALGKHNILVVFTDEHGRTATFSAKTFVTETKIDYVKLYGQYQHSRELAPASRELKWEIHGVLVEDEFSVRPL